MQESERVPLGSYVSSRARAVGDEPASSLPALFRQRLKSEGLLGALALLNQRTRYRFTGLYRVAPPHLLNVALFDRENPSLNVSGGRCALRDSYCTFVRDGNRAFQVDNSLADERLRGHSARESYLSYAGVPVRRSDGHVVGTLCSYDHRPRITPPGELHALASIAPLLVPWLADDYDPSR